MPWYGIRATETAVSRLTVIAISDAFGKFWSDLAKDLDVALDVLGPADAVPARPETAAVVVAAGGAEREAIQWLETHAVSPRLPVLVVGTDPGRRTAMHVVTRGATDYFALPDDLEIFRNAVTAALNGGRARAAPAANGHADAFAAIVGESQSMKQALARAARLLPHRSASALIVGESGTGKELAARTIHQLSPRGAKPFVAVNCAAIPETLMESEIFGHEKGSFTGAVERRAGCFELADGGTLLLDEIGEMPIGTQAKLLRVLEDARVRRLGSKSEISVDVRVLAATNKVPEEAVAGGQLRSDLYYRLNVVQIRMPPLRDHLEDLEDLVAALLEDLNRKHNRAIKGLDNEVLDALREYSWPGNVRELRNTLERALIISSGEVLGLNDLPPGFGYQGETTETPRLHPGMTVEQAERRLIFETLSFTDNNKTRAAELLGISLKTLHNKLKEYENQPQN